MWCPSKVANLLSDWNWSSDIALNEPIKDDGFGGDGVDFLADGFGDELGAGLDDFSTSAAVADVPLEPVDVNLGDEVKPSEDKKEDDDESPVVGEQGMATRWLLSWDPSYLFLAPGVLSCPLCVFMIWYNIKLSICTFFNRFTPKSERVINFKCLLQPHMLYYITQYKELGFSQLTQMKNDYTTNSHYTSLTHFLFKRLGECTF